jgi:hypothetical protein
MNEHDDILTNKGYSIYGAFMDAALSGIDGSREALRDGIIVKSVFGFRPWHLPPVLDGADRGRVQPRPAAYVDSL